jgi:hypothetical protein
MTVHVCIRYYFCYIIYIKNEEEFEDTKGCNQNLYIEEEQTIQWPKEKSTKGQTIYKTYLYN